MNLDLVVLESNPIKTKLITLRVFRGLVALGVPVIGAPVPVIPVGILSSTFKIVTYPPMVKEIARYAEQSGLVFDNVYGIVQTKLFEILPDAEIWCDLAVLLGEAGLMGRWLSWGLDLGALDKSDIDAYINESKVAQYALDTVDIEDVKRSLEALKL